MNDMADETAVRAIDISDVMRGIGRRWRMIAAITAAFALLGLFFIVFSEPLYTSEARLLVEYQDSPYTRTSAVGAPQARQVGDREVKSQVEVLKSRDLALKTLRKLKLIGKPEFDALKRGSGLGARLKAALGFSPDPGKQTPEQRALTTWNKRLKVYSIPLSKVVVIEYSSHDPRTAQAVANTLAELYVRQTRQAQLEKTGEARNWLKEQIEKLRKKVIESEVAVERYRARAGLFKGAQSSLRRQELSELSSQILKASAERSRAQAQAKAIREMLKKTGTVETSAEVLNSRLIQRLREQQVALQRRLAEISTVYLENHPKVRAVRREMDGLKRQIRSEALKIAASLEHRAKIAAAREASLREALAKLKAEVSDASVSEVRLRELEREASANRSLLESFLARYTDAAARSDNAALPGMARVISRAGLPAMPSFPRVGPIMILATLAGLVLGLGVAFIIEVMAAASRALPREKKAFSDTPRDTVSASAAATPDPVAPAARPAPAAASPGSASGGAEEALRRMAELLGKTPRAPRADAPAPEEASAPAEEGGGPHSGAPASASPETENPEKPEPAATMKAQAAEPAVFPAGEKAPQEPSRAGGADAPGGAGDADFPALVAVADLSAAQTLAMSPAADAGGRYARAVSEVKDWLLAGKKPEGALKFSAASIGGAARDAAVLTMALGRMLALEGVKTIVVDADMSGRSLNAATGRNAGKGLSDLLTGQAGFVDVIEPDGLSPLHTMHAGDAAAQALEMTGSEMMSAVLDALEQSYDAILLNEGETRFPAAPTGSVLPLCGAVAIIASGADAALSRSLCGAVANAGVEKIACLRTVPEEAADGREEKAAGPREDAGRAEERKTRVAELF